MIGEGTGTSEDYIIKTPWDTLREIIDEDVEKGNGSLIRLDNKVYGISILGGFPIAFSRTSEDFVKEIKPEDNCILPMEVEQYRIDLLKQVRGLLY